MNGRLRTLIQRVVPRRLRVPARRLRFAVRPPTMRLGVGRGLRFDPGPSNPAYARGDNELPVQHAFATHVRPGAVVFDVGANVGFFTVIAARLAGPSGRVVAFEPVPANARLVRRNARLNDFANVTLIEKAVSDRSGTGELQLAEYSGGAALSTAAPPPDATETIAIELVTIDDLVDGGDLVPPDLVKIDVEGSEIDVLRGMTDTMRQHHPVVICEVDDGDRARYDEKYEVCTEFLGELGYELTALENSYAEGEWIVGHIVAIPRSAPT